MKPFTPFLRGDGMEYPPGTSNEDYIWYEDESLETSKSLYNSNTYISEVMETVSMMIYSITLLLGTFGNGLVIFFTGFCIKKTVTTIWYLNLAVADFIFSICLSSEIMYMVLDYHWPLGRLMCKLHAMVLFLTMFASVFFLTAISADRCASVVHPVWAVNHRTVHLAIQMSTFIWIAATLLSCPYSSFRDTLDLGNGTIQCAYSFDEETTIGLSNHRIMVAVEFIIGFLIPFSIILACYCSIVIKLRRTVFRQVGRSFKVIVVIVVTFFCCWFPFHVFSILDTFEDNSPEMDTFFDISIPIAYGLVCLNSCLNPILYVFCGSNCRKTSLHALLASLKGAFSENWVTPSFASNRSSSSTSGVESSVV